MSKSELAFESPRVEEWEVRLKLLLVASLAYAFLLHLLAPSFEQLRAYLLRTWWHRTGTRYRRWRRRSTGCARPSAGSGKRHRHQAIINQC